MEDKPKKVYKNKLFLDAVKDIKKNQSPPILLPPPATSQKDTIGDKNKSETETLPTASESSCANDLNEDKSRKNVELSSEFQLRNDKTNIGDGSKSSKDVLQNNSVKFDELSITDQSNTLHEKICKSVSHPTSNQKHFSSPSYKKEYVSPNQEKHNHGSRSEKYCKNNDKTGNIDKGSNKFKYHRSYSETDHSRRFSKSNKVPEFYKESGDNWCYLANEEIDARFSLNRNSNRHNSSSHNDYKSESNSADLDTWANYKESDLGMQHSIHENRHANYVQPKLNVNQETTVKYSLNRNNNRPNSVVLTSSHNDYKSESTSAVDLDTWANYKDPDLDVQHSVHKNRFANNGQPNMSTSTCVNSYKSDSFFETGKKPINTDFKSRRIFKDVPIPVWNSHLQHSKYRQSESHLSFNVEPKIVKCKQKDDPEYNNFEFLSSTTENFIPPPILPPTLMKDNNQINSTCGAILDQNETTLHTITSDSTRGSETKKEIYSTLCEPDSKQLEAITAYVVEIVKKKSVSSSLADKVVRDLNSLFKNHLEGNVIDVYGSFYSNLAISTSGINLVMKSDTRVRSGFMFEVYKVLSREQEKYNVHPFEEERAAKILFSEPYSYVSCQLAYLGKKQESTLQMGKFLKNISLHEQRVRTLIIAVKIWAEVCLINDVEGGQLHPVGFIMLMIHFLQHYEKPILPIPINFLPNGKLETPLPPTSSSIGELWVSFLKYFALIFNWSDNVVTVTSKETVSKKSKGWDTVWMAIEDPITGQNIAKNVVHSDTAEFIKASFKSSYDYFCNPPVDSLSRDSTDESNEESGFEKWEYSFEQCMADQSEFFCEMCDNLGETCEECKKKICAPTLSPVPQMTEDFLKKIKDVLLYVNEKYVLTEKEVDERKQFVENLQMEIRNINYVYKGAELSLFGSSVNGFGFKNGDLDICLTLKYRKFTNSIFVLKDLLRFLRRKEDCDHPFLIYNATIPIVKFHYKPKGWRVDICVNNTLAVYNSRLLHTYTKIDKRCKILGCALRLLAKKAMIAEVTDKALSPYAYSIMVIHYLQQTNPPVLPVLQDPKLHTNHKLADIVENCNIWFYEDIKKLERSKNDTPVEQLWLQMLDYYCSHDVKNQLITITEKEQLLLSDKQIKARFFNIQDPFIREKNLGSKVSQRMATEIENVFVRARNLFRTPKEFPSGVKDMEDYFFSTMSLTGRIHKEALCDLCGKFGHEKKDCKKACVPVWRHPRFTKRMYPRNCTQIFKKS